MNYVSFGDTDKISILITFPKNWVFLNLESKGNI